MKHKNKLIVFQNKNIRRIWHNSEWHFSVVDVILVLTNSIDELAYWRKLKQREPQLVTNCHGLKAIAKDRKMRVSDFSNKQGIFRIIQSIPSKKAEPFKLWLAKVGSERIDEIENPELAQERMKSLYEQKGYSKEWIDKRSRGIAIRQELTGEWKNRDVGEPVEYAILTDEISKATFGKTVKEYKKHKSLNRENLRDHMGDLELIFSMLGEKVTTEITKKDDVTGFDECKDVAKRGGNVAKKARVETEKEIGKSVVSKENYLFKTEKSKRIKNNKKELKIKK